MDKKLKKKIRGAAKKQYPLVESETLFNVDSHSYERPAFIAGAEWAVKEIGKEQVALLEWLQEQIGSDYSISPHQTYEQLVEEFNKQRK